MGNGTQAENVAGTQQLATMGLVLRLRAEDAPRILEILGDAPCEVRYSKLSWLRLRITEHPYE